MSGWNNCQFVNTGLLLICNLTAPTERADRNASHQQVNNGNDLQSLAGKPDNIVVVVVIVNLSTWLRL
jgi:hypothetical protein